MTIKSKYLLFSDEQIASITPVIVEDSDPDAPTIVWNNVTENLVAVVRKSSSEEDMQTLLEYFDMVRIDWLGVLGYEEDNVSVNHQIP